MGVRNFNLLQRRFVDEYLVDLNGTKAAIRAGYALKTAPVQASRLLKQDKIQKALIERQRELRDSAAVTPERVIQEYARLAFADMADYVSWDGLTIKAKASAELPEGATRAVAEVTETITQTGRTFRFKLHDKKGALDSLAKHLGLFPEPPAPVINQDNRTQIVTFQVVYDPPPPAPAPLPDGIDSVGSNGHSGLN